MKLGTAKKWVELLKSDDYSSSNGITDSFRNCVNSVIVYSPMGVLANFLDKDGWYYSDIDSETGSFMDDTQGAWWADRWYDSGYEFNTDWMKKCKMKTPCCSLVFDNDDLITRKNLSQDDWSIDEINNHLLSAHYHSDPVMRLSYDLIIPYIETYYEQL